MITDFIEFENESMGGCESFRFIPTDQTQSTNDIGNCQAAAPTPKQNYSLLAGLSIMDTLVFSEVQDTANAGNFWKTNIKGFVPKLTVEYLQLFTEMSNHTHIVIPKDNNGKERVCGNIDNGMFFSFNQESKESPAGSNGYSFEFNGKFSNPSPFLLVFQIIPIS